MIILFYMAAVNKVTAGSFALKNQTAVVRVTRSATSPMQFLKIHSQSERILQSNKIINHDNDPIIKSANKYGNTFNSISVMGVKSLEKLECTNYLRSTLSSLQKSTQFAVSIIGNKALSIFVKPPHRISPIDLKKYRALKIFDNSVESLVCEANTNKFPVLKKGFTMKSIGGGSIMSSLSIVANASSNI